MMAGFRNMVLSLAMLLTCTIAEAAGRDGWPPRFFDPPAKIQTVKASSGARPSPEVICTFYADLMVRETGTDSPAPEAALMVPIVNPSRRPPCDRRVPAGRIRLDTTNFGLVGRSGPYLFFEASDPNGAVPFSILDAVTGHVLVRDSTKEGKIQVLETQGGALHLSYTRGVNAACSILQDDAACWANMVRDGSIPAEVGASPSPKTACAVTYLKGKTPPDDPSLVFYDVELTLKGEGPAQMRRKGPIGCEPLP
jgi:hypothetical protein